MNQQKNGIFERNCSLLQQYRPAFWQIVHPLLGQLSPGTVSIAPNGLANLHWPGPNGQRVALHPQHDPSAAYQACLDQIGERSGQILFLLGFGLGYEAVAINEHCGMLNQIKIIDHDPRIFVEALRHTDLSGLITNSNVHIFITASVDDMDAIVDHADRWYLVKDNPYLLCLKGSSETNPAFFRAAHERLYRAVNAQLMQTGTTIRQAKPMLENTFHNFSTMVEGLPLESLAGLFQDRPAVLVAAGPSLKKNIHLLKGLGDRCVIIAVDSAVPHLLAHGIVPHFVAAMDFRHRNADPLWDHWDELAGSSLIYTDISTPYIPKFFKGQRYYVISESLVNEWFNEMLGQTTPFLKASTVAQLALFAARLQGCEPIIMIGQDLAYEGPVDAERIRREEMVPVPGVDGKTLYTTHEFLGMISRFESQLVEGEGTVIDATEGGARIKHTTVLSLADSLATYCHTPFGFPNPPENSDVEAQVAGCLKHLEQTAEELLEMQQECEVVVSKASWAFAHLTEQQKKMDAGLIQSITVSEPLAEAINTARQKHRALVEDDPAGRWYAISSLLDTLMGEVRLGVHRWKIEWLKTQVHANVDPGLSAFLVEMQSHQRLFEGMIECICWFLGKIEVARQRLRLSLNQSPPDCALPELLAWGQVFLDSLDIHPAQACFTKVLEQQPEEAMAHFGLGRALFVLRDSLGAQTHLQKAALLDPALKQQVDDLVARVSAEYLDAAKDRIKRNRAGAERFLRDILPGFPDYQEARQLLAERVKGKEMT